MVKVKSLTLAVVAAALLSGGMTITMPAAARDTAAATAADPARVAVTEQIYSNLAIIEILSSMISRSVLTDKAYDQYTPAQRTKLSQLFADDFKIAAPDLRHKMAVAHTGKYSMQQLTSLLSLSKIRYVQLSLAQAANPALATPDKSTMTAAEKTVYDYCDSQSFVEQFLSDSGDFSVVDDELQTIATGARQKLDVWTKAQPTAG